MAPVPAGPRWELEVRPGLAPFARFGDDMEQFVLDQVDDIAELSARISQ
jgi:hypothetical protein